PRRSRGRARRSTRTANRRGVARGRSAAEPRSPPRSVHFALPPSAVLPHVVHWSGSPTRGQGRRPHPGAGVTAIPLPALAGAWKGPSYAVFHHVQTNLPARPCVFHVTLTHGSSHRLDCPQHSIEIGGRESHG